MARTCMTAPKVGDDVGDDDNARRFSTSASNVDVCLMHSFKAVRSFISARIRPVLSSWRLSFSLAISPDLLLSVSQYDTTDAQKADDNATAAIVTVVCAAVEGFIASLSICILLFPSINNFIKQ